MSLEEKDFDPQQSNATALLMWHIVQKGWQAGSVLGVGVAMPLLARRWRKAGVLTGERVVGAGLVWGKPLPQDGIEDRVYRLHYNEGQNRTNRFAAYGALGGSLLALTAYPRLKPVAGGAALGTALGVGLHCLTYPNAQEGLETGPAKLVDTR
eukprot:jgi/Astpho2/2097/Aster-00581